jgi:hypothetical protein
MQIAFVVHTDRCALLLDPEGVCRWVLRKVQGSDRFVEAAQRCIGAQFVGALDPFQEGVLGPTPAIGKSALFARVVGGRASLVRVGPLSGFDTLDEARTLSAAARLLSADSLDALGDDEGEEPATERDDATERFLRRALPELPAVPPPRLRPGLHAVGASTSEAGAAVEESRVRPAGLAARRAR